MDYRISQEDIQAGVIFSETPHYKVLRVEGNDVIVSHYENGGTETTISKDYVLANMLSANHYGFEEKVTKTEIRAIFANIVPGSVFSVCFDKADKARTKKNVKAEKDQKLNDLLEAVEKARRSKRSMRKVIEEGYKDIIDNPILDYTPGEERVLVGWKTAMNSNDGKYAVMDAYANAGRAVNVNTIKWLIYNGVRYEIK